MSYLLTMPHTCITALESTHYSVVHTNLRELGQLGLSDGRFTDDCGVVRGVQSGPRLVPPQDLLQGLWVATGTLGTHVVEERSQGRV